MYNIEFYRDVRGRSELLGDIQKLRIKAPKSKDARIQHAQIALCIQLLQERGTAMSEHYTKHLEDGIWELRPGNNRVLYFFYRGNTFVLLHMFRKKTQRTPRREIQRAMLERADYLNRLEVK